MTSSEYEPQTRDEVLASIRLARAELEAAFAGLSEEQLAGPATSGGWSIKDHLAHIATWQGRGLAVIKGKPPYEGLGIDREIFKRANGTDDVNEIIFRQHKDRPVGQVLEFFRERQREVESVIEQISDVDLQRGLDPNISPRYRRVVDIANSNFAGHDRDHIEDIRALASKHVE